MDTISHRNWKQINWSVVILFALGFWLSSSLILDVLVIPGLATTGMMNQGGFASAGYAIFGTFNRIELICAALTLTGYLVLRQQQSLTAQQERWSIVLASVLLGIALIYTYILTPQMSSLGLSLNLFAPAQTLPEGMMMMHASYWGLEIVKLLAGATLLRWCYRRSCSLV
jgi:hypothetical protein